MTKARTIVLVDDQESIRVGLTALLKRSGSFTVLDASPSGEEAIEALRRLRPDFVLLDLRLPTMAGPDLVVALLRASPGTAVVMYTVYASGEDVMACIAAGAQGYLSKDSSHVQLEAALTLIGAGKVVVDFPEALRNAGAQMTAVGVRDQKPITARQLEMLRLIAAGRSNPEIAEELGVSLPTVKNTLRFAMERLGVSNRTAAAVAAQGRGLI